MDVTATASQQRTSFGPGTASLPSRHSHSRTGSHSITGGPTNASHRVVRRKSMTSPHGSVAAIAAAVKETGLYNESLFAKRTTSAPKSSGHRSSQSASFSTLTSPRGKASDALADVSGWPSYVGEDTNGSSAVTDGPPLSSMSIDEKALSKSRIRRASEGSRLSKPDSRKAGISELRCDKCGKGYKHSSCLTKHLWEHTPEWAFTSKLLISKHQQVQLLEAASVLVAMNGGTQSGEQAPIGGSDNSSASPAASASSEIQDEYPSSASTTPPPSAVDGGMTYSKRYSGGSAYSRSYQSTSGTSMAFLEGALNGHGWLAHHRQHSDDIRSTLAASVSVSGSQHGDEEQADLAAAVGLLSCSYGTPKSGPVTLPADVPPVPPLPAKFANQTVGQPASHASGDGPVLEQEQVSSYRYHQFHPDANNRPSKMEVVDESDAEKPNSHHAQSSGSADEDEDGVFGKMEE